MEKSGETRAAATINSALKSKTIAMGTINIASSGSNPMELSSSAAPSPPFFSACITNHNIAVTAKPAMVPSRIAVSPSAPLRSPMPIPINANELHVASAIKSYLWPRAEIFPVSLAKIPSARSSNKEITKIPLPMAECNSAPTAKQAAAVRPVTSLNVVIWFGVTGVLANGLTPIATSRCNQVLWLIVCLRFIIKM